MREEWAHPEASGEAARQAVVLLGPWRVGWVPVPMHGAEQSQHGRLVAALAMPAGQFERVEGDGQGLVAPAGEQVSLGGPGESDRLAGNEVQGS